MFKVTQHKNCCDFVRSTVFSLLYENSSIRQLNFFYCFKAFKIFFISWERFLIIILYIRKTTAQNLNQRSKIKLSRERDVITYFQDASFYRDYQKLETGTNIFDTRETFLLKMHNRSTRYKFLNSLNRFQLKSKLPDKNKFLSGSLRLIEFFVAFSFGFL